MPDAPITLTAYLTVAETAEVLSLSAKTVRRMISRGELRAFRFGRLIRIAASDLDRVGRLVTNRHTETHPSDPVPQHQVVGSGRLPTESWDQWARRRAENS